MINSYSVTSQVLLPNEVVVFTIDKIKTGCGVTHSEGSASFSLSKPGIYAVTFNGTAATNGAAAGDIIIQLQENGTNVIGALSTATSSSTTDLVPLSFTTLIRVRPSCCAVSNASTLTFVNTGVEATYSNVSTVITRIC